MSKKNGILKLVAIFASCAAIVSACNSAPPVAGPQADENVASAEQLLCTDVGNSCSNDGDCCSNQCWSGSCQCVATADYGCTKDADCCPGNVCGIVPGTGRGWCGVPNGAACPTVEIGSISESCLSHRCNRYGDCDSCVLEFDTCSQDSDCCQGECRSGTCHHSVGGTCNDSYPELCVTDICWQGTCQCIYPGDAGCSENSDCCSTDGAVCNTNNSYCCIPDGVPAVGESSCCHGGIRNGLCDSCVQVGFCSQDSDCCSGSCVDGWCHECVGYARSSCSGDIDCCGADCRNGTCCGIKYQSCSNNNDCCSNSCVNGSCQ